MKTPSFCFNIRSFAAWMGCILFAEFLGTVCFRSAITTIERRFSLASTTTALLTSGFQIGSVPFVILVSYFGNRYHRPRTIAIGCALMCFGFVLMVFPQFLGGRYEFIDISSNKSTSSKNNLATICQEFGKNITCDNETEATTSDQLYLFILLGLVICGIGSTPVQPLGFSYIDDHALKHNAAVYIGLVTSVALVAPALGFLLGSFVLKLWVDIGFTDISEIKITPSHPGWVGAWWIGILTATALLLAFSLPMWFYPRKMVKEQEKVKSSDDGESRENNPFSERVAPSLKVENGNILTALKRIFTNRQYLLIVLIMIFEMFRISGLSTFSIKYYEVIFGKSASTSSFLVGAINLPALVVGTVMGSYAIKRWKLTTAGITKLSLISLFGSFIFSSPDMFIGCDTTPTAGLTVPYPLSNSKLLSSSCNADCGCDQHLYTPVCGPGGITYVSPCHAGCLDFSIGDDGKIENYTQCSCVDADNTNATVSVGRCPWSDDCSNLIWIIISLKTIASWFGGLHATPLLMLLMRSLKKEDKAFGIGTGYFVFRLVALVPGPVVFGAVIDQSCLHWMKKPCSDRFYCSVFDNVQYRYSFFGLCYGAHALAIVAAVFYYFKYAKKEGKQQKKDRLLEQTNSAKREITARDTPPQTETNPATKERILKQEIHTLTESVI